MRVSITGLIIALIQLPITHAVYIHYLGVTALQILCKSSLLQRIRNHLAFYTWLLDLQHAVHPQRIKHALGERSRYAMVAVARSHQTQ